MELYIGNHHRVIQRGSRSLDNGSTRGAIAIIGGQYRD